jgi:hypothetical protein
MTAVCVDVARAKSAPLLTLRIILSQSIFEAAPAGCGAETG